MIKTYYFKDLVLSHKFGHLIAYSVYDKNLFEWMKKDLFLYDFDNNFSKVSIYDMDKVFSL